MVARIDLTGQRFERLTVMEYVGGRKYRCVCDCGEEKHFFSSNLTRGLSRSCGCLSVEMAKARFDGYVSTFDNTAYQRTYRETNREKLTIQKRAYREANREAVIEGQRRCYQERRDYYQRRARERYEADPSYALMQAAERRLLVQQATPAWADRNVMAQIYRDARRLSKETGIPHEVDHIVPIKGETVCGLHWEGNLCIVTKDENRRKSAALIELSGDHW
jgi:hypothetical protein